MQQPPGSVRHTLCIGTDNLKEKKFLFFKEQLRGKSNYLCNHSPVYISLTMQGVLHSLSLYLYGLATRSDPFHRKYEPLSC